MIVAIDGPAGSGKSTTAGEVARRLGYLYLNTGAMYRAVALAFLRTDTRVSPEGAAAVLPTLRLDVRHEEGEMCIFLGDEDVAKAIKRPEVGQMASQVSTLAAVRAKLVAEQRRLGRIYGPDPEVRARRRQAELIAGGTPVSFEAVLAEIRQRDRQDRERALSPLRKADDAIELDTSHRSIDGQVQFVIDRAREREKARTV